MKTIRHGDIPFHKIDKLPDGLKEVYKGKEYIAAEGKTTGHMHRVKGNHIEVFTDTFGNRYMRLTEKASVSHEEHKSLGLDVGVYRIGKEREYDWFQNAVRKVID